MTTTHRIFNFSAGPAVLPLEVLEEAQRDLMALPGVGMSILEISHRSKAFDEVIEGCEADLRALAGIPANYHVLFLQGGASLQFSMVPMNLLPPGGSADYIVTGSWSEKAVKEAKRVGGVKIAASTAAENFVRVPKQSELTLDPAAAYVHYTTNNTIFGTEWHYVPDVGRVPLVADTSSDMFSRPIDVGKFGLIYAGAQKNLGPSGLTLVIVRDDLVARTPASLATMLQYGVHVENKSMYNTPPVFGVYIMRLVLEVAAEGGRALGDRCAQRAQGGQAVRRDRSHRLLPRPRAQGQPLAHERDVPPAERGAREEVREGVDRGRPRRPQGAPLGRRPPGVDLQRVPRGRRRRARGVHEGVRARERLRYTPLRTVRQTPISLTYEPVTGVQKSYIPAGRLLLL